MVRTPDADAAGTEITTPFRRHLNYCRELDIGRQLEECADYIQNIEILVSEFLESYYLVERLWQPDAPLSGSGATAGELVLEPFYESLEMHIVDADGRGEELLLCVSGAVSSLPESQHPALSRRGLDFIGLRAGATEHIVLGAAQSSKEETPFLLLLRALNAMAELSPPLRVAQLGQEVLHAGIPEDVDFSLLLGLAETDPSPECVALGELTRDLAEAFWRTAGADHQLSGMLGEIACVGVDAESLAARRLARNWHVASPS